RKKPQIISYLWAYKNQSLKLPSMLLSQDYRAPDSIKTCYSLCPKLFQSFSNDGILDSLDAKQGIRNLVDVSDFICEQVHKEKVMNKFTQVMLSFSDCNTKEENHMYNLSATQKQKERIS
ncbi:hypothetical protein MKW98_025622, partial [Papaver atlanticum]